MGEEICLEYAKGRQKLVAKLVAKVRLERYRVQISVPETSHNGIGTMSSRFRRGDIG